MAADGLRFTPNRGAERALARRAEMGRYLDGVSEAMAKEAQRRLPHPRILGGIKIEGTSTVTLKGAEGRVVVHGSGWHLWEYGTRNHGARPAIRPGVQTVLSKVKGRWKAS